MSSNLSKELFQKKPDDFLLVLGGTPETAGKPFEVIPDSLVSRKIAKNEISLIADNNIWSSGKKYTNWSPGASNYYIFNPENRLVYVLVDNLQDGRKDLETNLSTVIPSHINPEAQKYSDGCSWFPVFKVDFLKEQFLSERDLPIPDVQTEDGYLTLAEKYNTLCSSGATTSGSCCFYYKTDEIDDITGVSYSAGTLTKETIFSTCYECQKMAESLNREVTFLSGYTLGSITTGITLGNPLCPPTKIIKTIKEKLEEQIYDLIPGSFEEYQKYCLDNFTTNKGIIRAEIDLSGLSDSELTLSVPSPFLVVKDTEGTGAQIQLLTNEIGYNQHKVYGIQIVNSGIGYNQEIVDFSITGYSGTTLINKIDLITLPDAVYDNPEILVPADRYRIICTVTSEQISPNVLSESFTKYAIIKNPKLAGTNAKKRYTDTSTAFEPLQLLITAITGPCFDDNGLPCFA